MHTFINKLWYSDHPLRWFLLPSAMVYSIIAFFRRSYLQRFRQRQFSVPVIVVGNLTVGGAGKTPLVIALAREFQSRGLRVGIVSRGFRASIRQFPHEVDPNAMASLVGDEPLLLAQKTGCPVVIAPKRVDAVHYLLQKYQSQIVISDDGLQHYAMGRSIEIVVIDGLRGLGNGLCLPAGPLRESVHRLKQADFVVMNGPMSPDFQENCNSMIKHLNLTNENADFPRLDRGIHEGTEIPGARGQAAGSRCSRKSTKKNLSIKCKYPNTYRMDLVPGKITSLISKQPVAIVEFKGLIAAVAAIGNPERFFSTLEEMGVAFKEYPFADHHSFKPEELNVSEKIVVMTEKDAVKCQPFATDAMYYLPVEAKVGVDFWDALWSHKQLQGYKSLCLK